MNNLSISMIGSLAQYRSDHHWTDVWTTDHFGYGVGPGDLAGAHVPPGEVLQRHAQQQHRQRQLLPLVQRHRGDVLSTLPLWCSLSGLLPWCVRRCVGGWLFHQPRSRGRIGFDVRRTPFTPLQLYLCHLRVTGVSRVDTTLLMQIWHYFRSKQYKNKKQF